MNENPTKDNLGRRTDLLRVRRSSPVYVYRDNLSGSTQGLTVGRSGRSIPLTHPTPSPALRTSKVRLVRGCLLMYLGFLAGRL